MEYTENKFQMLTSSEQNYPHQILLNRGFI